MNALFEITTGRTGCSYERCYVWAESHERAEALFHRHHPGVVASVNMLLVEGEGEFITQIDDEGFGQRINDFSDVPFVTAPPWPSGKMADRTEE